MYHIINCSDIDKQISILNNFYLSNTNKYYEKKYLSRIFKRLCITKNEKIISNKVINIANIIEIDPKYIIKYINLYLPQPINDLQTENDQVSQESIRKIIEFLENNCMLYVYGIFCNKNLKYSNISIFISIIPLLFFIYIFYLSLNQKIARKNLDEQDQSHIFLENYLYNLQINDNVVSYINSYNDTKIWIFVSLIVVFGLEALFNEYFDKDIIKVKELHKVSFGKEMYLGYEIPNNHKAQISYYFMIQSFIFFIAMDFNLLYFVKTKSICKKSFYSLILISIIIILINDLLYNYCYFYIIIVCIISFLFINGKCDKIKKTEKI